MEKRNLVDKVLYLEGILSRLKKALVADEADPGTWVAIGMGIGELSKESDQLAEDCIQYSREKFNPIPEKPANGA